MLSDEQITLIINALENNYEASLNAVKNKYKSAKQCIQEMCPHSKIDGNHKIGEICSICGKVVRYY
jgi:hypothetical protein